MQNDDFDFDPGELHALAEEGKRNIIEGKTLTMEALREQFRQRLAEVPVRNPQGTTGSETTDPPT